MVSLPTLLLLAAIGPAASADRDGDGLSDFWEEHKYFTNPDAADSDGDGTPDGDWSERRGHTYSLRTVVQVMRPVEVSALSDDYQDARLLDEAQQWVKLEVVHYPLNTVASAIQGNPNWRKDYAHMQPYLAPGLTSNWDEELREKLVAALRSDGIHVDKLDDKQTVERVSAWLVQRARYHSGFTTFFVHFPKGRPAVLPGLEKVVEQQRPGGQSLDELWQRELFAKGMFNNRARGSCTSSAIYLNGCLRALGVPTRIVLCIPAIDASDPREVAMLDSGVTHHQVRQALRKGTGRLSRNWSSHTFNEVYVGGRWRRLNYSRLGQNILDPRLFGLMTHTLTVHDWSDAKIARTVGRRQGLQQYDDVFGGTNPYSTLELSDQFGAHATIDNPPVTEPQPFRQLTIVKAMWWVDRPAQVDMRLDDPQQSGHLLVRVKENHPDQDVSQYAPFYEQVGKEFVLRAAGKPDVRADAERGYWSGPAVFYLRIKPQQLQQMAEGVPYSLIALNRDEKYRWIVDEGVTLTRSKSRSRPPEKPSKRNGKTASQVAGEWTSLTIERLVWSDSPRVRHLRQSSPRFLLARPREWDGFAKMKRFTQQADQVFFLEAEGLPRVKLMAAVGGITSSDGSTRFLVLVPSGRPRPGVAYRLRPRNGNEGFHWKVADGLVIGD